MEVIDNILRTLIFVMGILVSYQVIYRIIGFILPAKKFKDTDKKYKYAVMIAARNEERVIAQLIESIKKQDYPAELITIFAVADNCTDNTACVARDAGAIVYERINPPPSKRRKGYALDFLVKNIEKDYGVKTFDGFFIFDADNLLAPNFVTEMNKAFDNKEYVYFNSYINIKNFGTGYVSSFASMTMYGRTANCVRPMSLLGISWQKHGTGNLVRSRLLENGYPWFNLVEDIEFGAQMLTRGYRGSYCEAAEYFDEQPQKLKLFFRQRMRWQRGKIILFFRFFPRLLLGIFAPYDFRGKYKSHNKVQADQQESSVQSGKKSIPCRLLNGFQKRFGCFDMIIRLFPLPALTLVYSVIYPAVVITYNLCGGSHDVSPMIITVLLYYAAIYIENFASNLVTIIREHKHIRTNPWKLVLFLPLWPIISIMLGFVNLFALLIRVKWKPIPHYENKEIEKIYEDKTLAERLYQK